MRIHVALLSLALLPLVILAVSHCGGGESKAAFERYDAAVSPLLDEEYEVWQEFAELTADAMHYGLSDKVGSYIRDRLVPFTKSLGERVQAIRPEGKELERIHGFLVRYVALREEFLNVFSEMEALDRRAKRETKPARDRIDELSKVVEEEGKALQPAFEAAPEFGASIRETLGQILATSQDFQGALAALEQGTMASSRFLSGVDSRVLPWFAQTKKDVAAMTATGPGKALQTAVLDYVTAIEAVIQASRTLAVARAKIETQGGPIQQKLRTLRARGDETLKVYKQEAQKYRNRLR